jgi:hypothetical protein
VNPLIGEAFGSIDLKAFAFMVRNRRSIVFLASLECFKGRMNLAQDILGQSRELHFLEGNGRRQKLVEVLMVISQVIAFLGWPSRLSFFEKRQKFFFRPNKILLQQVNTRIFFIYHNPLKVGKIEAFGSIIWPEMRQFVCLSRHPPNTPIYGSSPPPGSRKKTFSEYLLEGLMIIPRY